MRIICRLLGSRRLRFYCSLFFSADIQRVPFELHTKKGVFGTVRTEAYRPCVPPALPAPDTSVSSVRHQYRYRTLRYVRYDITTGTGHFCKFGKTWMTVPPVPVQPFIPVPDTSVISVQHQYRGTGQFGKFGTTSILVSRIPIPYRTQPCKIDLLLEWGSKLTRLQCWGRIDLVLFRA